MIYIYHCEKCEATVGRDFPMGQAAETIQHECGRYATRDFSVANIMPSDDPFRTFANSGKKEREEQRQQRRIEGPQDKFEKKHWEAATGRIYIGDDISGMSQRAQKAITHGKGKPV